MKKPPRPNLKVTRLALRQHGHFFVLHIHALHRANAFGKLERFGVAERLRCVPALGLLPHYGWIQALFDHGPLQQTVRCMLQRDTFALNE
jgi:hypothetical protein